MITKKTIYVGLSIVVFIATLLNILTSDSPNGVLDNALSIEWIILLLVVLLLPIFNLAEIIINREDRNTFYWIGLLINGVTIFFVMRYFAIELEFVKMFQE